MLTRLNTILLALIISTNFLLANEGPHDDCLTKGSSRQYVGGVFNRSLNSIGSFVQGAVDFARRNPVLVASAMVISMAALADAAEPSLECVRMFDYFYDPSKYSAATPQFSVKGSSFICPQGATNTYHCKPLQNYIKQIEVGSYILYYPEVTCMSVIGNLAKSGFRTLGSGGFGRECVEVFLSNYLCWRTS